MANKKLTKKELEKLQNVIGRNQEINQRRANLCLEKELAMRQIKANFEENWEVADLNQKQAQREQQEAIRELQEKYGENKMFDLDTGSIKTQE